MAKICGKLLSVHADRTAYKMYSPQLGFDNVMVEIEVPDSTVIRKEENEITLSLEGFTAVLDAVASSIDNLHTKFLKSKQG